MLAACRTLPYMVPSLLARGSLLARCSTRPLLRTKRYEGCTRTSFPLPHVGMCVLVFDVASSQAIYCDSNNFSFLLAAVVGEHLVSLLNAAKMSKVAKADAAAMRPKIS